MPRVHFVKKARKPNQVVSQKDIDAAKAGEEGAASYYWWKFRFGGKHVSKERPRASQLTQSDKLSRLYGARESLEDIIINSIGDMEEAISTMEEASSEVREVADEYQESADNQREYFPDSEQADECEEKSQEASAFADEIDNAQSEIGTWKDELEAKQSDESDEPPEGAEEIFQQAQDRAQEVSGALGI